MYTHRIFWKEKHPTLGVVSKEFKTTQDALTLHTSSLMKRDGVFAIGVQKLGEIK